MATLPRPGDPRGWGYVLNDYLTVLEDRVDVLEATATGIVGPPGPPGPPGEGGGFTVHEDYEGLTVMFGPNPIPHPAALPNSIYFVLPPRSP